MQNRSPHPRLAPLLLVALAPLLHSVLLATTPTNGPARWEPDIRRFEASDRTNPPPRNPIVFTGSSSIRIWPSLAESFPGAPILNRGFGGSQLSDVTAFVDRIVVPYRPRQIVLYAGENDLHEGDSPEQVAEEFRQFVQRVRRRLPRVPIVFLAIKPSPSRAPILPAVRRANALIARQCREGRRLVFVDVFTPMLGPDGQAREELFGNDRLHLNAEGYALWNRLLRPHLNLAPTR
jgi:lysophospholipase L1-like esterase